MGYNIEIAESTATFNKDKSKDIINAIVQGIKKGCINSRYTDIEDILECESVEEVFEELGFELVENTNTYIVVCYIYDKLSGLEDELYNTIAPYINNGFIEYLGEDGARWRYNFSNGKCNKINLKVRWYDDVYPIRLTQKQLDILKMLSKETNASYTFYKNINEYTQEDIAELIDTITLSMYKEAREIYHSSNYSNTSYVSLLDIHDTIMEIFNE